MSWRGDVSTTMTLPALATAERRTIVLRKSLWAAFLLTAAAWGWVLLIEPAGGPALVGGERWKRAASFVAALLGRPSELAPTAGSGLFLSPGRWWELAGLAYQTLVMSILAIWISVAGMLLTVMAGARPRTDGLTGPTARIVRWTVFGAVRGGWVLARAVPEVVWALLLVLVMTPGMLAGALALGVHNFGIVGKLCSEVVEDLDPAPAGALRAAGAGSLQVLAYAVLPQALPQFLSFALYRWEVVIRTTIVVGFVSAGGLGREFRLAMSFFHYTDVAMILATYFLLVVLVDVLAGALRGLARG